jgi:hypothetical protein
VDGYSTYVLNYQDAAGAVYTARIITNNPEPAVEARAKLERIYEMLGYHLLSADKIEEVAGTAGVSTRLSWGAKFYRTMVVACVVLTAYNIWFDRQSIDFLTLAKEKATADRRVMMDHHDELERHLARIEARQQSALAELERLENIVRR